MASAKTLADEQAEERAAEERKVRLAALQREEDARKVQEEVWAGRHPSLERAPDRPHPDSWNYAQEGDQALVPNIPPPPSIALGRDETALRNEGGKIDVSEISAQESKRVATARKDNEPLARRPDEAASSQMPAVPENPSAPNTPNTPNETVLRDQPSTVTRASADEAKTANQAKADTEAERKAEAKRQAVAEQKAKARAEAEKAEADQRAKESTSTRRSSTSR